MSNNAEFDALARELRALREEGCGDAVPRTREAMLVVRLVRGLSRQRWQEFCRAFPLSQWCALPCPARLRKGGSRICAPTSSRPCRRTCRRMP